MVADCFESSKSQSADDDAVDNRGGSTAIKNYPHVRRNLLRAKRLAERNSRVLLDGIVACPAQVFLLHRFVNFLDGRSLRGKRTPSTADRQ